MGVALGAGIQELRLRREEKERLRLMTFKDRLEAHQKAFYWCHKLNTELNVGKPEDIHTAARLAREWWDGNCLLLDAVSRRAIVRTLNLAHLFARDLAATAANPARQTTRTSEEVWASIDGTLKAITAGIGAQHLPDTTGPEAPG